MVRETVESLRAQSFGDFRAIVSDNCSPGDIADQLRAWVDALGDPRIRFVAQPANGGEYGQGRYLFAERGDADYFMILHDDDLLDPDCLAKGVATLDATPEAALFVADPRLIDVAGIVSPTLTAQYLHDHGRTARGEGLFPILDTHMATGLTPISGTLLRASAVARAGLVDEDCTGNFPFEMNVMMRLGDIGAQGWLSHETLLSVRYHDGSLRNTLGLMHNPAVIGTMMTLLERRRYDGMPEQRRRLILSRLHRARATLCWEAGDAAGGRAALRAACAYNPRSPKSWGLRALYALTAPPRPTAIETDAV
ncbi:glycosyltransferase family 2 protein [Sphingomonas sp. FARSPH]|jgi:glycosyltransferase involved in cell wall biosynthesis|uniref:glycosyltransferase family 2 protein n=2 Tax=unclassified Sphingomonas TaxID=196159 RepID=UPI000E104BF8|nr:glycosyltransferase [Sphingomonas sp. FARSPH]AXJ97437.1 hypothetical protein DM480_17240 [Sphingomonas sp. FARSPH]